MSKQTLGTAVLFLLLIAIFFATTWRVVHTAPAFDGAMNLQVAQSIENGNGFRRTYAEQELFPHEIQTGAPYILPAAVVFAVFGVGIPQGELVNIAYFFLLLAGSLLLAKRVGRFPLAVFAACTVAIVPGMLDLGFQGLGEIPALSLVFVAILFAFRTQSRHPVVDAAAAGVFVALAVATKTVLLIGAGAVALCLCLDCLTCANSKAVNLKRITAFALGAALVLAASEFAKVLTLGFFEWKHWWATEAQSIFQQAGVEPGIADSGASVGGKLRDHLLLLSGFYGLPVWLTTLWLALLGLAGCCLAATPPSKRKWTTLAVLLIAMVYMAWWLLITPTSKAWHRRIIDGMICADLGVLMVTSMLLNEWRNKTAPGRKEIIGLVYSTAALCLPVWWLATGIAVVAKRAQDLPDNTSLIRVAAKVRNLPQNAYVFGIGWHSAPRVSLLSGRPFLDFNDIPVSRLDPSRPIFFVQEPGSGDYLSPIISMYGLPDPGKLGVVAADRLKPAAIQVGTNQEPVRTHIAASLNYPFIHGANRPEGANGRWLSSDNLILLRPSPGNVFRLRAYVAPQASYTYKSPPLVTVTFDSCSQSTKATKPGKVVTLSFQVPASCLVQGRPIAIRIEVDNLLEAGITRDDRALSLLAKEIGFF